MSTWSSEILAPWVYAIRNGDVSAAPAEGVYGYTASPFHVRSLQAMLEAKDRAPTKGYIVLIESVGHLSLFCPDLPEAAQKAVDTYWQPGQPATTLILPALPHLPRLLTGGLETIAIRMPQVGYMQEYLAAVAMPIVSTSLNISGQPPAISAEEIPEGLPALTLPQPLGGTPSRIYNPLENIWLR